MLRSRPWGFALLVGRLAALPVVLIAVGMGMSNGPASSASTACVPARQVGEASGISNQARYVGAATPSIISPELVQQTELTWPRPGSDCMGSGGSW